ncbi:MAG: PilZ domain-containing protein [Alkalispirochaeta sp.]
MNTVATGFETSLVESIAVVAIVAAVVLFFVLYGLHTQYRRERVREQIAADRYRELAHLHNLTPSEERLVEQLAGALARAHDTYLLLENQGTFNQAAEMLTRELVTAGQISGLRVKLGFTGRPIGLQPRSSVDIPAESAVTVERAPDSVLQGIVKASASNALRIRIEESERLPTEGTQLRVVYQNEAGMFAFDTVVLIREEADLYLQHSERIDKRQQRRHYRRALQLPVSVYRHLSEEDAQQSEFIDVGGGGASLHNPSARLDAGDTISLVFQPLEGEVMEVPATVIRTSRKGAVLHVRYGNIREAQRDRIYRMLFYTS